MIRLVDQTESFFCLLNSNQYPDQYKSFNWKLSFGSNVLIDFETDNAFEKLRAFQSSASKNIYGLLSYDLKNEVEKLSSTNTSYIKFPSIFFFEEKHSITESEGMLCSEIEYNLNESSSAKANIQQKKSEIIQYVSKNEYIENVKKIQKNILDGDVYELNYCIPFEISLNNFDPIELYFKLNEQSPNPFSGILKLNTLYILSASPERFIRRVGNKVITQPIKGTIKRSDNVEQDKQDLYNSKKERAENVMIVDLVRNDLTKTAVTGSINVEELFGIYTFPQLHQMISTVTAEIDQKYDSIDVIKNAFPMGSMTGAPKVKAMELIEEYECFKRGAYSGAMGYIDSNADFDFNVLIRSIFIDTEKNILCFNVGSAITIDSIPEEEYEECLLKAKAIFRVVSSE